MRLAHFFERTQEICLYLLVFLLPLLFCPRTMDVLELSKQSLVLAVGAVLAVAMVGQAWSQGGIKVAKNWLHLPALLLPLGGLVAALFSVDRYASLVGGNGQLATAFVTQVALVVVYFTVAQNVRSLAKLHNLLFIFLASSLLTAVYGLLQILQKFILPIGVTRSAAFTTVGSPYALAAYLVIPLILSFFFLFFRCREHHCLFNGRRAARLLPWLVMAVSLAVLVLVDFWIAWVALGLAAALLAVFTWLWLPNADKRARFLPVVLLLAAVLFLIVRSPVRLNLPAEITPSAKASWQIARQVLNVKPLFGTGQGTWIYDYALYHVQAVNLSPFWAARFDHGFSFFLDVLGTQGLVGIALWLALVVTAVLVCCKHFKRWRQNEGLATFLALFAAWLTLTLLTFFYRADLSLYGLFWILLGLLAAFSARGHWAWDKSRLSWLEGWLTVKFIVCVIGGAVVLWLVGQRCVADIYFAGAVQAHQAGAPLDQVISRAETAEMLNPWNAAYSRNLSQAHLLKAAELIQKGAADAAVQAEMTEAIKLGKAATSRTPADVDNWNSLAMVYENIAPRVAGADDLAIKAYQEAIKREPHNPTFWTAMGRVFILRADKTSLQAAAKSLNQAVAEKADFLPAHYYLAQVFERQGSLQAATAELEKTLSLNNRDVGVAFELAILYYAQNDKARGLNLMEQVVKFQPDSANARWYLASMYKDLDRLDDSLAQLNILARQLPDDATIKQALAAVQQIKQSRVAVPPAQSLPAPLPEDAIKK